MATPEGQTKDGFETQFGVNHLGHFLLFKLLEKTLIASSTPAFCSRVVSLSSSGHKSSPVLFDDLDLKKGGYTPFKAYGQAKTANIYLANEVIACLPRCIALAHPGSAAVAVGALQVLSACLYLCHSHSHTLSTHSASKLV